MPCRFRALFKELCHDWDRLNLAAKILVILAAFLFASIIFIAIYQSNSLALRDKIEVIFRSAMASIFGFILSSNTKNSGIKNCNTNQMMRCSYEKDDENNCYMNEEIDENNKYYYNEGNSIQIFIALITAISSGVVMIFIMVNNISSDEAILSQFRDFMCTSIGFLIGESKIKT